MRVREMRKTDYETVKQKFTYDFYSHQEVHLKVLGNGVYDLDEECQGRCRHHHNQRLAGEQSEHQSSNRMTHNDLKIAIMLENLRHPHVVRIVHGHGVFVPVAR